MALIHYIECWNWIPEKYIQCLRTDNIYTTTAWLVLCAEHKYFRTIHIVVLWQQDILHSKRKYIWRMTAGCISTSNFYVESELYHQTWCKTQCNVTSQGQGTSKLLVRSSFAIGSLGWKQMYFHHDNPKLDFKNYKRCHLTVHGPYSATQANGERPTVTTYWLCTSLSPALPGP